MNTTHRNGARGHNPFCANMLKSTLWFLASCFIWALTYVAIDKAHLGGWIVSGSAAAGLAIAACTLLGVVMIAVFIWHLKTMDELQQKIQLSAMGFSLGVTLVGSFTYSLLVTTQFVAIAEIHHITLLLTGSYIFAVVAGQVRYR